jgi:oligopeptide transport system substrate-binding protein
MRRLGGRFLRRSSVWRLRPLTVAVLLGAMAAGALAGPLASPSRVAAAAARDDVKILSGAPDELDPALQGDIGSAAVGAQLYETLTGFDPSLVLRPALAESWEVLDGGRRVVFHLRDGLTFSDGTPLTGADVVRSWLRIVDPRRPSPLASLMADVSGADAYLRGTSSDPSTVGLSADGNTVEVRLDRPATDFPSIVSSPTFAIVPPSLATGPDAIQAGKTFVGSGAYRLSDETPTELTLTANEHYWAGAPAIKTVHLITTLNGRSPVQAFEDGELDYAPIGDYDADWIRYDRTLGSSLRTVPSAGLTYFGFDTSRPPFNDVRVRQAFAWAVDWKRIVRLAAGATDSPATSMVPPGIPGRSDTDFSPTHDPDAARAALAAAGFPGGAGFPEVTLVNGSGYDDAVIAELERELGIHLKSETWDGFFGRLSSDPPAFWSLGWVADYPGPNDFLGLLLGKGSTNNYGRWDSPEFDQAISDAAAATDQTAVRAAYDRAEAIVQNDAPVVPLAYGDGYALAREGLLGATESGLGIMRLAGLDWSSK